MRLDGARLRDPNPGMVMRTLLATVVVWAAFASIALAQPAVPAGNTAPQGGGSIMPASPQPPRYRGGPAPPAGYVAPGNLSLAAPPPAGSERPTDWIGVGGWPADDRTSLYGKLHGLSGGNVHVVFWNGAGFSAHLEGCATTGMVVKLADGGRQIFPFEQIEWVRAF